MSYDLTIWKWSALAETATPDEVLDALNKDEAHPAMRRFDARGFVKALYGEFGGEKLWSGERTEPPFSLGIADFTGNPANWIGVSMGYHQVATTVPKLVATALRYDLVVFDHQAGKLYGG